MMAKLLDGKKPAANPSPDSASSPAAASGIRRFEPADGLFLRAEHLRQIEDYARDLSLINGLAGGPGVVYGYTLDLDPARQVVGAAAGLAVDPSGQPLRSQTRLEADLSGLARTERGRIWIVEVLAAEAIPAGNEPMYSAVCATSCGPESSIQPWRDDAVQLRVRAQPLYGDWVDTSSTRLLLSALVSAYFDQERRDGDPWLTPTAPGAAVPGLGSRPWASAAPPAAPGPAGVPLGILAWIEGQWVLDVWSARRDRLLSPPDTAWQNHLGLRPRPVFTAQVLQFADQFGHETVDAKNPRPSRFVEVPPAGFLPLPSDLSEGQDSDTAGRLDGWLSDIFGDSVELRLEVCSADVALSAVALAQHQDRIPLVVHGKSRPRVEILIPGVPADLPALTTTRYGWVAFVRSPRIGPSRFERVPQGEPTTDDGQPPVTAEAPATTEVPVTVEAPEAAKQSPAAADAPAGGEAPAAVEVPDNDQAVGVHVMTAPSFRRQYLNRVADVAGQPAIAELSFPSSGWAPVNDDEVMESIREAATKDGGRLVDVVVTTPDADREPLMAARARALAMRLGFAEPESPVGVFPAVVEGPETVYLVIRGAR
jgi:hypothetical protein